ncbi:hypothetical protein MG290_01360 [Flavobacterium sp. CBA20B-1]|uniref:hypothetical protein n=1 Tax=unclassified Flavobacterium TaxID=196869 RepID=UPI002224ED8F|nr:MULTISPECIES: hypothetical protein [unclassified Flavobacterium]WCM42346.1 hypothetical protein MG290_01360 [Flavobacterium sp. CBA20B-1]
MMTINKLRGVKNLDSDIRLNQLYNQFDVLLSELRNRRLPDSIIQTINSEVEEINTSNSLTTADLRKVIKKKQTAILKLIENELKLVPKNYHRNLWLALGMTVFGIPLGVLAGVLLKKPGLFAIGLPIGVAIGVTVGTAMDKKAVEENRQLNIEIKY